MPKSGGGQGGDHAAASKWSSAGSASGGTGAGTLCGNTRAPASGGSVHRIMPTSIGCAWTGACAVAGTSCFDARCAGSGGGRGPKRSIVARAVASRHGASDNAMRLKRRPIRKPRDRSEPSVIRRTATDAGPSASRSRRHGGPILTVDRTIFEMWLGLGGSPGPSADASSRLA